MPANFSIAVDIPKSETRAIELFWVAKAVKSAAHAAGAAGGTVTSGTMTGDFGVVLGTWTYTPEASA